MVILIYIANSRPAWATKKNQNKTKALLKQQTAELKVVNINLKYFNYSDLCVSDTLDCVDYVGPGGTGQ